MLLRLLGYGTASEWPIETRSLRRPPPSFLQDLQKSDAFGLPRSSPFSFLPFVFVSPPLSSEPGGCRPLQAKGRLLGGGARKCADSAAVLSRQRGLEHLVSENPGNSARLPSTASTPWGEICWGRSSLGGACLFVFAVLVLKFSAAGGLQPSFCNQGCPPCSTESREYCNRAERR